jgi:membrane protein involved in colicin uptake
MCCGVLSPFHSPDDRKKAVVAPSENRQERESLHDLESEKKARIDAKQTKDNTNTNREDDARRIVNDAQKAADYFNKKAEEDAKKAEDEAKRKKAEDEAKRKKVEEDARRVEADIRKAEEAARWKAEDDARRAEDDARQADGQLGLAKVFEKNGDRSEAIRKLEGILKNYPKTPAAKEAQALLAMWKPK